MKIIKFTDDDNLENSFEAFINTNNRLFIQCGTELEEPYYNGFVTLSKEDVIELVSELNKMIQLM